MKTVERIPGGEGEEDIVDNVLQTHIIVLFTATQHSHHEL